MHSFVISELVDGFGAIWRDICPLILPLLEIFVFECGFYLESKSFQGTSRFVRSHSHGT